MGITKFSVALLDHACWNRSGRVASSSEEAPLNFASAAEDEGLLRVLRTVHVRGRSGMNRSPVLTVLNLECGFPVWSGRQASA